MPKLKSFRDLSRSQKHRRLKQMQTSGGLIIAEESTPEELSPNVSVEIMNGKVDNESTCPMSLEYCESSFKVVTDQDSSEFENNTLIDHESSFEIEETAEIHEDLPSPSSQHQPLSLRSKLILWADENKVTQKSLTSLLGILKEEGHIDLPSDGRTLMKTPRQTKVYRKSGGQYYHYGLENGIIDQLKQLKTSDIQDPILINVNIDGLPVSKSSKSQLWPILAQIHLNEPTTPFVVGAFHGYTKPSTDRHFLAHFVKEYKKLNRKGFEFQNKVYRVKIRAIICDAPARAFVTCTKGHNGYFGCSKCTVEGDYENNRMLFLDENCPLRTDESFRLRLNPEHHTGTSPFESIPLGMVTHFTLDYMHLICLGVVKKLLRLWLRGSTKIGARLSAAQIRQLSEDIAALKAYMPCEFVRVPTSFEELDRWKATELRVFLLYLGLVVAYKYLPHDYMKHFVALHCAIRILCHPKEYSRNNQYAKELLTYFVQYFKDLYGEENMIYNVHNLIHLSDDAKRYGPLDSFSAFPFENHLHSLKKLLRKFEKPLQQIHRRISEKNTANELRTQNTALQYPILISRNKNNLPFGCYDSCNALKFSDFKLSCSKDADRYCFLKNNKIVAVRFIGMQNGNPIIIGQEFKNCAPFPLYPCDSTSMNVFLVSDDFTELKLFPTTDILRKAVLLPWGGKSLVLPLLHSDII